MKQIATAYSISGSSVTMTGVNVPLSQILLVSNATTGAVLYSMAGPAASSYTQAVNSVIGLATTPSATDRLTIFFDDGVAVSNGPTSVSVSNFPATQPVSGTVGVSGTVPVSLATAPTTPVTGTFWQATQPVSGPLTDTQLRATAVPVSGTVTANTGLAQPLTDTQLRATAVPVQNTAATPAGSNRIGNVGRNAGSNVIGKVTLSSVSGSGTATSSVPLTIDTTGYGVLAFQIPTSAVSGQVGVLGSVDGTTFAFVNYTSLPSGTQSPTFTAATATLGIIDVSGLKTIRFSASLGFTGPLTIPYNLSGNSYNLFSTPLPAGSNTIGNVNITRATSASRSDFTANADALIVAASTGSFARQILSIYNIGPAILRIGLGSTAVSSTNFTYLLNAGDTYIANPNEIGLEHRGIFAAAGSVAEVTNGL